MSDHDIPKSNDDSTPSGSDAPAFPWSSPSSEGPAVPPFSTESTEAAQPDQPVEPVEPVQAPAEPAAAPAAYAPPAASQSWPPAADDGYPDATQPLPPFEVFGTTPAAEPPRRTRRAGAGLLVGALLLGGAAGVGGAAGFNAWDDDPARSSSGTSSALSPITATNAVDLPEGSVEKVAAAVLPSVVKINVVGRSASGSGSGVVLNADGTILTNNHVVDAAGDGGTITVNFNDGRTVPAEIVGTDPVTDMAVIKAEATDLVAAELGKSEDLQVGQSVVAVGSPFGLNATVTTGIVSALNRPVSVQTEQGNPFGQGAQSLSTTYPAIQTDAAINPGNSGGPLVNLAGQVVGINSSIRTGGSSEGSIGLGFSIPIDEILPIVNQIIAGETPTHARLAITVSDVEASSLAQGALVREVEGGGPADDAGLEQGDVITKIDEDLIEGSESLIATIRGHRPSDEVSVTYVRDGETRTTTAVLGSDAETEQP